MKLSKILAEMRPEIEGNKIPIRRYKGSTDLYVDLGPGMGDRYYVYFIDDKLAIITDDDEIRKVRNFLEKNNIEYDQDYYNLHDSLVVENPSQHFIFP